MKLVDILNEALMCEGVYDPSIFKAIFVIGGIGSGKSYVTDRVTKGLGFKVVDPDVPFERLLRKNNMSLKATDPDDPTWNALRDKGTETNDYMISKYLENRLGLIITGTGHNFEKIAAKKKMLDDAGYDTFMIFVNTSLGVSLERNRQRYRSIPDEVVKEKWHHIQQNLGKYHTLLGANNFEIVDNSDGADDVTLYKVWKKIQQFSSRSVKNPIARSWIQSQLDAKRRHTTPFSGDTK